MPGPLGIEATVAAAKATQPRNPNAFLTRVFSGLGRAEERDWGARNYLTPALAFSHAFTAVFPPALYATHPEYFPLVEGKRLEPPARSYFWNPDIARPDAARHAAEAARKHFDDHPDAVSFALGINDGLVWGESPELLQLAAPPRWFRERPDYSNLVFTFMNRAATELARTHPDKYLGALAYYWCEKTPDFPLHPQVLPFLTADRSQGYDPAFTREEFALQERWTREAAQPSTAAGAPQRRIGIYDYVYGSGFLIPRQHPRLLAEHLRHARDVGFTDYYAEVSPNWGLDGPQPWLLAQLLLDPRQSETALLGEYYAAYFRESAAPMRRFFERCAEQWMRQPGPPYWLKHYRNESQAIVFPSAVCRELRGLLEQAAAVAAAPLVRARVQFVRDAFGVTERFIAFHEARDRVARASLAVSPDPALAAAMAEMLAARREFIRYTLALRREQPMALARFLWEDYLRNDPLPQGLIALRRASVSALPAVLEREPLAAALWPRLSAVPAGTELLRNSTMSGPVQPARQMAGLTYGVPLAAEWTSKVEPAQHHRAELNEGPDGRVLRISGSKDTMVSQWTAATDAAVHRATIRVRGRVSPSTVVNLVISWLDAQQRYAGYRTVRLPDGEWPHWVELQQAALVPPGARWVGLALRVQNQTGDDWVDATGFSVRGGQ